MRITASQPQARLHRVFFEGQEISSICVWADDEKGEAGVIVYKPDRRPVFQGERAAVAVLKGKIQIIGIKAA